MSRKIAFASLLVGSLCVGGCAAETAERPEQAEAEDAFTSDQATLLDLDLDGEVVGPSTSSSTALIKSQLFFTVGQLNAERSVSRLSKLSLSKVTRASIGGGLVRVRYHAKLPVAWGSKTALPSSLALTLPRRGDASGLATFRARYGATCSDAPGDVTDGNFWYHFRPAGCALAAADVTRPTAAVTRSPKNTTGKYPELDRVWEDGALQVVAIFGKYERGATTTSDAGVEAYDRFVGALRAEWSDAATTPAALPATVDASIPEVTVEAALADGRAIIVTVKLVDELRSEGAAFDKRFAELTPGADLVLYNGHAGLGTNVAALAQKGAWFPGKYQILFVNGCDTFAYQDDTLAKTRAALNPTDPSGTKHLDVLTNAMPAYFSSLPSASMALLRGLTASTPRTYEAMFRDIDRAQVVVVDGEEDNTFTPGAEAPPPVVEESGTVTYKEQRAYETSTLPAGTYAFEMTPEPSTPGGDADLRVRVGAKPDATQTYKCPSYRYNSNERCVVTLASPAKVYFTATGDKSTASSYVIRAFRR
ncbi:MAG: hypothetical protein IT374_05505 [Polyangiaceae bacterium]|nr:hypothetical protein [Polyangiaceae bacterium]